MARLRLPVLYLAAAVLLGLAVAEWLVYSDRILPGVRLAGVQVAGRSTSAARTRVALAAARSDPRHRR